MSKKTAFVLSGGASLGAIQVGMVRALYERGVEADLIVGTSVGSINGGFLASRPQTRRTADELAAIWRGIGSRQVFPLNPFTGLFGFFGARDHLVPDRGLRQLIERRIDFDRLEQASIPLHVIATDLLAGREVRLSAGDAVEALMASAAIPGVFPAVDWHGRKLIDGGVSNHAPIADAIELGAERVYVLATGTGCDLPEPPRGAVAMLLHATSLLMTRRLLSDVQLLSDRAELIVLPPPCPLSVAPMDFSHTGELIERGYDGSSRFLDAREAGTAPTPLRVAVPAYDDLAA